MYDTIKKMFIMQLRQGGIPEEVYHFLTNAEKEQLIERNGRFFLKPEARTKIKVALTGGVFDIIHIGHIVTLNEAKKHCDVLVVAIAKNEHIKRKGREPIHDQEYRKIMVECLKPVDLAISGFDDPKEMIELVGPDIVIYGYDQKEIMKIENVEVIKLQRKIDDKKFKTGKILEDLGL